MKHILATLLLTPLSGWMAATAPLESNRLIRLGAEGFATPGGSATAAPAQRPDAVAGRRPNFVLIMADDLGYGSLGCYGSQRVRTPQIDQLAADGLRFTDYHANSPYCSPTRAAMLTGRYPERCTWVDDAQLSPVYRQQRRANLKQRFAWGLALAEVTLPGVLRGAGYRTALIGKWHLGYDRAFHPLNFGFDEFRGHIGGAVDYHTHRAEFGRHELDWWNGKMIQDEPGYATDLLTGYAVDFIKRHREQPFLLCLMYGAPHVPLQGRDPQAGKAPAATYIEMIGTVDDGVGRVRQALRENGLEQNTLLIFCSDNGADNLRGIAANGPLRGLKGELTEGGLRVPCIARWPGRITPGSLCGQTVMGMDWFATFAGLAGATLPKGLRLDGVNLGGVLADQAKLESRAVHWLLEDRWAVREGPWKLLGRGNLPQELYHLDQDLGESRNLLADQADLVRKLQQQHQAWLGDVYARRKHAPELKLPLPHAPDPVHDLVVYGDSSGAAIAAISARREGRSVIWVNPTGFPGGMSASGLGATDFLGRRNTFGGLASEFYDSIAAAYGTNYIRSFEPHVGKQVFEKMIAEAGVTVIYNEKLDRVSGMGVTMDGKRITAITTLSGRTYRGKMFIDASCVGDLMAAAGVTYTVGREPESQYGEDMAGVRRGDTKPRVHYTQRDKDHFVRDVDPYVKPGDPSSGLLPHVSKIDGLTNGQGDTKIQAYNYRVCLTADPKNHIPIEKPAGYREIDHELLLRNFDAGDTRLPALVEPLAGPGQKVDWNNMHAVGSDYVGTNWDYPEASYERRRAIEKAHETYIRGFLWTMANSPRVPEDIRKRTAAYGLPKDEFTDNGGWPWMIYIREARRMVGDYVMTQLDCAGIRTAPDPVGLGSFGMDSHCVQHIVTDSGKVQNEGVIWRVPPKPYGISYRSIIPRRGECENLLSPICVSASHVAHGSIRMEPVFMALSQSAALAAGLAIDSKVSVQDVAYPALHKQLLAAKQVVDALQVSARKPKATIRVRALVAQSPGQPVGMPDTPYLNLPAQETLMRILDDTQLPKSGVSGVRLADIRNQGSNPHVNGFPRPDPIDPKSKVELEKNAEGLMLKAESEYSEKDAKLGRFFTDYWIPTIPKVRKGVTEEERSKARVAARPADDPLQVQEDIVYNKLGKRALLLDLYTPKDMASKPWPVVIQVHGGGWDNGSHRYLRPLAMSLAAKGFACITVEYRLGGEASFPAAVWDVKAAVRWVRKNAKQNHLDTEFIIVAGASAGGNIAGLVGVTEGDPRFEGDGEHREFSSKVHGIISLDGAIGWVGKQWTVTAKKDPWLYNEGIPLFHMIRHNRCPPILCVGGGRRIAEWITVNIADSQARYIDFHWPHGFELFDPSKDELVTLLVGYLNEQQVGLDRQPPQPSGQSK